MNKHIFFILIGLLCFSNTLLAQAPIVTGLSTQSAAVTEEIVINGSNFGTNLANIQVWFGAAKGTITSLDNYLIRVQVPIGATYDNIAVINTTTGLVGYSSQRFYPSYSGEEYLANSGVDLEISSTSNFFDIVSSDLDQDGLPDLILTKDESNATDITILKNQSTPDNLQFTTINQSLLPVLQFNSPTTKVVAGDIDGNGKPDLLISKGGTPRNAILILENTTVGGNISFTRKTNLNLPNNQDNAIEVKLRDLDGDGKPDLLVSNSNNNGRMYIFQNTSSVNSPSFNTTPITLTITGLSQNTSSGLDVADLNNDGRPEIIVSPFVERNIAFFENESIPGQISFKANQLITTSGSVDNLRIADINDDGKKDLIFTQVANNVVSVMRNLTNEGEAVSFVDTPFNAGAAGNPSGLEIGDVNGDGKIDLVVSKLSSTTLNVFINNTTKGSNTISFESKNLTISNFSWNVNVGDLDADGKPDFAITSFRKDGSNNFTSRKLEIVRNISCYTPKIITDTGEDNIVLCAGQTKTLKIAKSVNVNYTWYKEGEGAPIKVASGADNTLTITSGGEYYVVAESENSACSEESNHIIVEQLPESGPTASIPSNSGPVCEGNDIQLNATTVSGASYLWEGPNGYTSEEQNPLLTAVSAEQAGIYHLTTKVGDCLSQVQETIVEIESLPSLYINSSAALLQCAGGSTLLTVTSYTGYAFQWLKDGEEIANATSNSLTVSSTGDYTVEVTNTLSENTCAKLVGPVEVIILNDLQAAFTPSGTCVGTTTSFSNTTEVIEGQNISYAWEFGDGATSDEANPSHDYAAAGSYQVELTVTYTDAGCSDTEIQTVVINEGIVPEIALDGEIFTSEFIEICPDDNRLISIVNVDDYTSISWVINNSNQPATTPTLSVATLGTYALTLTDINGCVKTYTYTAEAAEVPTLTGPPNNTVQLILGNSVTIPVITTPNPFEGLSFLWTPSEGLNDATVISPTASPTANTTYTLTATTLDGCEVNLSVLVEVIPGDNIVAPKFYSPNGDGQNDTWVIPAVDLYSECTLTIYDRNGRKVFEQKGYNNDWDGTANGKELAPGTYYFLMNCPDKKPAAGNVLLVR
ncbi:FG-GAP-like repeat-containing protein [Cytophagales bacterium LB-30]|uniref:FG-GAP-like repeat-containing protein n=1 Tax=Shiella aurantiaca TaxID=3058365 RepID=A0ABT8F0Z8_9BACT|nr:FG-GAP-like repeat-containing protein [Shiella aurantiaca]MDN4163979.1 FG-GAP-like repeat-containing protein [Shiella aurantiaca]